MVYIDAMRYLVTFRRMDRVHQCTQMIFLAARFARVLLRPDGNWDMPEDELADRYRHTCEDMDEAVQAQREPRDINALFKVLKIRLAQILFDVGPVRGIPFLYAVQAAQWFAERTDTLRLVPEGLDVDLRERRPEVPEGEAAAPPRPRRLVEAMRAYQDELVRLSLSRDPRWAEDILVSVEARPYLGRVAP